MSTWVYREEFGGSTPFPQMGQMYGCTGVDCLTN